MEEADAEMMPPTATSPRAIGDEVGARIAFPPVAALRSELTNAVAELCFCELASSAQWIAELACSLRTPLADSNAEESLSAIPPQAVGSGTLCSTIMLAKTCFNMREYGRAAHTLQGIRDLHKHQTALFLRFYSLYLAGEKRREEEAMEVADPVEKCQVKNQELKAIEEHLAALRERQLLNGLNLYLYGIVLRGLDLKEKARAVLMESVHAFPCNWSAWLDIIALSSDMDELPEAQVEKTKDVPDHWMAHFFRAALSLELQRNEEAHEMYTMLRRSFPESSYVLSQIATCQYNMRNFDASQTSFEEVRKRDPFKLSALDTYSNILYVKEQAAALSHLARQAIKIDKYTPEACCIVGNYHSLKGEHAKSVTFFQRALSLNRNFTPAWILMGHEFMEMKNTPAAIDAYRNAVNISNRDYRAWYGLGQTYELLNLHFYALFYYRRAMTLRPEDARMWCAMAQCYEAMGRNVEAIKCYEKAHRCGDRERMALPRLARLHRDMGDKALAAVYYLQMLPQSAQGGTWYPKASGGGLAAEAVEALKFLMVFYHEEGKLADCEGCAAQLLDTAGPERDEAKAILQNLRGASSGNYFSIFSEGSGGAAPLESFEGLAPPGAVGT